MRHLAPGAYNPPATRGGIMLPLAHDGARWSTDFSALVMRPFMFQKR